MQKIKKLSSVALLSFASLPFTAQAASFEFDKFSLEWDTVFTAGVQYRIEKPNKKTSRGSNGVDGGLDDLPGVLDNAFIINSNDGNNNFSSGFTAQRISILTEADFNFGEWGIFSRAKVWYDFRYGQAPKMNQRAWSENNANPVFGGANKYDTSYGEFNAAARNYSESGSRLLDLFWYGSFTLFDHDFSLRVGRQVISWGEAMLSGGGINMATSHVDAHIRNQPGLEIKELFLPSNAIYLQTDITDSIGLEAFLQLEWQPAHIDPSGTYFSEFDSIGAGGNKFMFLSGTEDRALGKELKLFDMLDNDYQQGQGGRARTFADFHGSNDWSTWNPDLNDVLQVKQLSQGRLNFQNATQLKNYAKDLDALLTFLPTTCDQSSGRIDQQRCTGLVPHKVRVDKAKNTGQFGLALKFFLENGDELGLYYVNYHEKIPNFVLPIDAIEDMAPVIDLLVNVADRGCYSGSGNCDYGQMSSGSLAQIDANGNKGFQGIADLDGTRLSMKQINALLLFLSALPEDQGTIGQITSDLVSDPRKILGDNPSPGLAAIADTIANDPLLNAIITSQAIGGADKFLGAFGMGKDTVVRSINYRLQYAEDVHLLGATYSTIIGSANVATEITYRQNTPLMLADIPRTPKRFQLINWHVNMLQVFEPVSVGGRNLWDFSTLVAEVLTWYVPGATAFDKKNGSLKNLEKNRLAVQNSPKGIGASVFWSLEYHNITPGWNLMIPVYANYGIYGAMFNSGYRDGQAQFATGLTFQHTTGIEIGLGASFFFGKTDDIFQILTQDRDNVTAHFKYSF